MFFGRFLRRSNYNRKKKIQSSVHRLECLGVQWAWIVSAGSLIKLRPEKKGTVVWPSVAMLDCFGGFVAMFFGGFLDQITNYDQKKRYSRLAIGWNVTSKTCLTMEELFAGPSSMAMGNQPMPSRYPLRKRLSESGLRGLLLTLWSGRDFFFFCKHINAILIWYTTQLNCPQTIDLRFPRAPLAGHNSPSSPPLSRWCAFGWLLCDFHSSVAV